MPDAKTYQGGCHCGRVRYEATSDLAQVVDCNCSICVKRGALWAFVKAPQFKLLKGEDALTDYQFGKKNIHHLFCQPAASARSRAAWRRTATRRSRSTCAASTTSMSPTLKLTPFDGKSL